MEQPSITFAALEPKYWGWLKERVFVLMCEDTRGIVVLQNGVPVAIAVFDHFIGNSCFMHLVIENKHVTRSLFRQVYDYIFCQCGLGVLYATTQSDDYDNLRFNARVGWREVHRLKDAKSPGVDLVIQELRKSYCDSENSWLNRNHIAKVA